jgi:transcription-repair coupling factor (superfamily II helicase)
MQRLPPRNVWRNSSVCFRVGQQLQLDQLETTLLRLAYRLDERVDEPGEAAIRSEVVDIYPAGSDAPYRLDHRDGRITEIRRFDPLTQRTMDEVEELGLDPASEVILNEPSERFRGIEHWLPQIYGAAETLFDYLPAAAIVLDAEVDDRRAGFIEQIADAYASRSALLGVGESDRRRPLTPDALYLDNQEWEKQLGSRAVIELSGDPGKGQYLALQK